MYKTLFFAVCIFILTSFLTTNSGKLFIDSGTSSTEFEHLSAPHEDDPNHHHLRMNVGQSGGRDVVIEPSGALVIGSVDPCLRYSGNTYLVVEGDAVKQGDAQWDGISDRRLKDNISLLKESRDNFLGIQIYRFTYKKSGKIRYGVMAQEVKDIFPHSVGTFWEHGVEYYTFNPNNLFFEGMKVIQENAKDIIEQDEQIRNLAAENEQLSTNLEAERNRNDQQQKEIEAIKAALADLDIDLPRPTTTEAQQKPVTTSIRINTQGIAQLQQNIPNPFPKSTTIPYYLPEGTRNATLTIHDMTGKAIAKHILPTQTGAGKIEVDIDDAQLRGGTFTYSLYINEALIDTKKMVLLSK